MNFPLPRLAEQDHFEEWSNASAVHPEIVALNVRTLHDLEVDRLAGEASSPIADLLNWNVVRFGRQVRENIRGWWVSGVDPLNGYQPMEWGRFKPDVPFHDRVKSKAQKYASPTGAKSRLTLLRVPDAIWQLISDRYGVPIGNYKNFWRWVAEQNIPVIVCEGEKKAGCLLSLGYAAIALPGVFNGYRKSTNKLIDDLAVFGSKGRPVYICFDHDTKEQTRRNVNTATSKLGKLFAMQGCKVHIIELPGPEKGVDDFVVARGREAFDREYQQALPLHQWQTRLYSRLTYESALELNQDKLGPFCILGQSPKLVCMKSPKGSGKTYSLKQTIAKAREQGQRVLLITHRVQLGQDICQRVGLPYITEAGVTKEAAPHGYGLCIDSLHPESQARFDPDDWQDAIVIIDEVEQVIWHLLDAATEVKQQRLVILEQLQQLLIQTFQSENGNVILLDADLTDVSINFVLNLAEARHWIKPWIVVNRHCALNRRICHHYNQSRPSVWLASLIRAIANGEKCFIATQGQRTKSVWSAINFESMILKLFPQKTILRIDSETISEPSHPAYGVVANLDAVIDRYDIVIATPTIETGVSIEIRGHFDSVWGCFWGVSSANSARQALARVRDDIPRHVWATGYSNGGKIAGGATTKYGLRNAEVDVAQAAISRLQAWWEVDDGYRTHDAALHAWSEMACRINTEMLCYRQSVIDGMSDEGYRVEVAEIEASDELVYLVMDWLEPDYLQTLELTPAIAKLELIKFCYGLLKGTREFNYTEECLEEFATETISDSEGELLKAKRNKTREERLKYRKWRRHKKYGGVEITFELIQRDDDGWYPQLQLAYYLSLGRPFLKERDGNILKNSAHNGKLWYPVFNRSQLGVKVGIFEFFNISALINPDREYSNDDDDLIDLLEKARTVRADLKAATGVTAADNDTPIRFVSKLLSKLGLKLKAERRTGSNGGKRPRVYRFVAPEDGREEVLKRWFERDTLSRTDSVVSTEMNSKNMEAA